MRTAATLETATPPRVAVSSFASHVTYTCPLACAHCCFSSSPAVRDRLHTEHIAESITQIPDSVRLVAFTGGEPFLLGRDLDGLVAAAHGRGFTTRVVTSAYWARSESKAASRLRGLKEAGLDELSISWDDFHEEFVPFAFVKTAFHTARSLGLVAAINTVQTRQSRWTRTRLIDELGLPEDTDAILTESPINLTGRAAEKLADAGLREFRTLGPCPYVLSGPTLSAKNQLLACCGVIPNTEALVIDADFRPENLAKDLEDSAESVLLNWLYLRGPYAIMEYIGREFGVQVPNRREVGGNCEACSRLFNTPEIVRHLAAALERRRNEVSDELALLDLLGLVGAREVQQIWRRDSIVVDTAPLI